MHHHSRPASTVPSRLAHRPLSRLAPSPLSHARQQALAALSRSLVAHAATNTAAADDAERLNAHVDRIVAVLTDTTQAHNSISKREIDASYREYQQRLRVTHGADVADALRDAGARLNAIDVPNTQVFMCSECTRHRV